MAQETEIEVQGDERDEDQDEAFVTYDIAAYPSDPTLSVISEMWSNAELIVPKFQRNFVWDIKRASLLIESFMMNIPVPQAFIYVDQDDKKLVIDGLQRIMSIVYFMKGYFGEEDDKGKRTVFSLHGLNAKSPYSGKRYEDFSEAEKRKFRSRTLRMINIKQISPKDSDSSAYHIFERLNTGGIPLKPQEIRNCVYHGKLVDALVEMNRGSAWRKIVGKKQLDKHQKDVELILRVLAFTTRSDNYDKPMKEFVTNTIREFRDATNARVQDFIANFESFCAQLVSSLGERPFHIHGPLNASALDAVMSVLFGQLDAIGGNLTPRFRALIADQRFLDTLSVSTSDKQVVANRMTVAKQVLLNG